MPAPKTPLKGLLIAAAAALTATASLATDAAGSYIHLYGGPSTLSSTQLGESRPGLPTLNGKASFASNIGLGGAYGYRYGNGWAAEIQWDYRRHYLKSIAGATYDGDFASNVLFVNGYYRFNKVGSFRPLIGAGIGWAQETDIDIARNGQELSYSRSGGMAVQAIVGGEMDLAKKWSLVGDVRWMRINSGSFKAENTAAGATLLGQPKYQPVSVNLGITYKF
ncbi:MAG: outer membrane beta-barrel protein [Burkholderiaceae bacterium]